MLGIINYPFISNIIVKEGIYHGTVDSTTLLHSLMTDDVL